MFTAAARDLETAAADYHLLADDASAEATAKALLAGTARAQAADATRRANKLSELIG